MMLRLFRNLFVFLMLLSASGIAGCGESSSPAPGPDELKKVEDLTREIPPFTNPGPAAQPAK